MLYNRKKSAYLNFFLYFLLFASKLLLIIALVCQILRILNVSFVTVIFMFVFIIVSQINGGFKAYLISFKNYVQKTMFLDIVSVFVSWLAEVLFLEISSKRAHRNYIFQILADENDFFGHYI